MEFRFERGIETFTPELHGPVPCRSGAIFEGQDFQWSAAAIANIAGAVDHQHTICFIRNSFVAKESRQIIPVIETFGFQGGCRDDRPTVMSRPWSISSTRFPCLSLRNNGV